MSIFSKPKPQPEPEVAPPASCEDKLLGELNQLDAELDTLRREMRAFRAEHFCLTGSGIITVRADSVQSGQQIAAGWRAFTNAEDGILRKRNGILEEWSELRREKNGACTASICRPG